MRTRRLFTNAIVFVTCIFGISYFLWSSTQLKNTTGIPFKDSNEMASEIAKLRAIGTPGVNPNNDDWKQYAQLALNAQVTDKYVVKGALLQVISNKTARFTDVKLMILLRVCFECRQDARRDGVFGGFTSASAFDAGRTNLDMNWPVRRTFGVFWLQDTIDGYMGAPYDPVAEFDWFSANCSWRKL
ncbi:MAG: hypothetical protein JWR26_1288 [Pedosphaera sp.]|nr:hypothetical protein [Pedosphaera sp.]